MRNLILPIGLLALIGVAVSSACSSSTPAVAVTFTDWPTTANIPVTCSDGDAILVSADECNCGVDTSYAICSGGTFSECACSSSGYTVITVGSDSGNDTGSPDATGDTPSSDDASDGDASDTGNGDDSGDTGG